MTTFTIQRQIDKARGCIPACAISVLAHQGRGHPEEAVLIERMGKVAASGFQQLRQALMPENVSVEAETPGKGGIVQRLGELTKEGHLVLVAISGTPRAHCVVVEHVVGEDVVYQDPHDGRRESKKADDFRSLAAGDLAVILPAR